MVVTQSSNDKTLLKARGPHYIFKAIEECAAVNSRLISTLEPYFHDNFFKLHFSHSIWVRLDRFNETHWSDREEKRIRDVRTRRESVPLVSASVYGPDKLWLRSLTE